MAEHRACPDAASPVRPTVPVDAQLLGTVAKLDGAGLGVVSADPAAAAGAIADMHLAQIYACQGNTAGAAAAVARAKELDPTLAGSLEPKAPGSERNAPLARSSRPVAASVRVTGTKGTLAVQPAVVDAPPSLPITVLAEKQAGLLTGVAGNYAVTPIQWPAGGSPATADITSLLYTAHAAAASLPDALNNPATLADQAVALPHDYFYVIPLALAECYEAMGDYANAETYYLQAAGYQYINTAIEGPYVWLRLANCTASGAIAPTSKATGRQRRPSTARC